jgi:hypothetical protein
VSSEAKSRARGKNSGVPALEAWWLAGLQSPFAAFSIRGFNWKTSDTDLPAV